MDLFQCQKPLIEYKFKHLVRNSYQTYYIQFDSESLFRFWPFSTLEYYITFEVYIDQ